MTLLRRYLLAFLGIVVVVANVCGQQAGAEEKADNKKYVNVDKTNPDAVLLDKPDRFADPIAGLAYRDEVEVLDEEKGGYVKIRLKVKGKWNEGWIKKSVLSDKSELTVEQEPEAAEAEGASSSVLGAKGSVGMNPIDMEGFDETSQQQDPWDSIDPTSPKAKCYSAAFPTHVVVPAAAIVVGGAVAIGLSAQKTQPKPPPTTPDPPAFVLLNDNYSTPCGVDLTIYPLQNDDGTGLTIVGLQNAPPGVVLLNDSAILIPSSLSGDATFDILIEDSSGQSGSSTVTITLEDFSIEANNDQYNVDMGESVSGNVLNNDLCTSCTVVDISGGDGLLDWSADGSFTYTASFDFAGETSFIVSLQNACGNQATSMLTFIVSPPAPCGFDWPGSITTEPADCGLSNGKANPQDHVGGYNFSWSNGVNAPDNEDIPSGTYELLVTDTASGCVDTLTIEITELPVDYALSVEAIPGTCGETDNAILNSNAAPDNILTVSLSGSTTGELTNVSSSTLMLGDAIALNPGLLTITVYSVEAGAGCSQEITHMVEQSVLPDMTLTDDVYEVNTGETTSGNVLENDVCQDCQVTSVEDPEGTLDWQANGDFTYTATADGGEVSFVITVTDGCGQEATETLTFIVSPPAPCGFDWPGSITTESADCGFSNGKANAQDHVGGYNFSWSNGVNAPDNEDIPSGTYELLITDTATGCVDTLTIEITELPVDYALSVEAVPGTCGETDNAILNSNAAPDNVLTVSLSGSSNGELTNVSAPTLMLGDAIALNPGLLTITVYSVEAGAGCSQEITHTVEQSVLPDMSLTDDVYEVNTGETTSGNVLENDVCQDCQVTSVEDPEGTLDWQANGDFTYTATADGGEVSFVITVTDGCGQEATETLNFIVSPPAPCGFDWPGTITTEPSDCGFSNGAATAAGPTDGYDFAWDNGIVGPENANLPPGLVELVITDQNSNCTDTLTAEITELPVDYALEVLVIPGLCGEVDGVQVNSNASPSNLLVIDVSGATNGTISGVDSPQFMLADYLALNPGELILTVFSEDVGPGCAEIAVETIMQSDPAPEVFIMEVVQPQPPEMIGAIYLEVLSPSFPVDIVVNGDFVVTAFSPDVALEGLEPGPYEIFAINTENGCTSEPVFVELVPGGIMTSTNGPHWSPAFSANSSWMGSPQALLFKTPEGGESYVLEPNLLGSTAGGILAHGKWFATASYSAMRYHRLQGERPASHAVSYIEFAVGSTLKIKTVSAALKIGQSNWSSRHEGVLKARGWFVEGALHWPLKNLPGSLKTGVRAGMLEGRSKVLISPQIQWAFSQ